MPFAITAPSAGVTIVSEGTAAVAVELERETPNRLIIETRASIVEPRRTFRCCFVGGG